MKDIKQIKADIRKLVQDTVESGAIGHVDFFTARVISDHAEIEGADADFYIICARETINGMVKAAVNKYDTPEADTPLMEGFEQLKTAYPIHRNGDHLLVPIQFCTDEELESRADEFGKQAKGLRKHAKEIRAYILQRKENGNGSVQLTAQN